MTRVLYPLETKRHSETKRGETMEAYRYLLIIVHVITYDVKRQRLSYVDIQFLRNRDK